MRLRKLATSEGGGESIAALFIFLALIQLAQRVQHKVGSGTQHGPRDRFRAGVSGTLEVVESQQAVAGADEDLISSMYAYNLAKAALARATGLAEKSVKDFLGGR